MEIDEMKQAWQTLDRRLEEQSALSGHLFRESRVEKAERGLRPMIWRMRLQVLFGIAFIVLGAVAWSGHLHVPIVLASGLAMHLYGILMIIAAGRTLLLIRGIDYAAPVLEIQQAIARIRQFHLRCHLWLGNAWWFLWMPAVVDGWIAAGLPMQFVERAMPMYVWGTVIGIVGLAIMIGLDRFVAARPALAAKLDYYGGFSRELQKVSAFLDEIARFEKA
jgi:hypothetical protein